MSVILTSQPDLVVCAEAADGKEAIDKTRELNPDLVILDITMPILNRLGRGSQDQGIRSRHSDSDSHRA